MRGWMPRCRSAWRFAFDAYPLSASSLLGRRRGRPTFPRTGEMWSTKGISIPTPGTFDAVNSGVASGVPGFADERRHDASSLNFARSVGFGPVFPPRSFARAWAESMTALDQSSLPARASWYEQDLRAPDRIPPHVAIREGDSKILSCCNRTRLAGTPTGYQCVGRTHTARGGQPCQDYVGVLPIHSACASVVRVQIPSKKSFIVNQMFRHARWSSEERANIPLDSLARREPQGLPTTVVGQCLSYVGSRLLRLQLAVDHFVEVGVALADQPD